MTIRLFRTEFIEQDPIQIDRVQRSHSCKVKLLNIFTLSAVLANCAYASVTLIKPNIEKYDSTVFVCELLILGLAMLAVTIYLVRLMSATFPQELCDEKHSLKVALGVFLSTYLLRAILKFIVGLAFAKIWANMWRNLPLFTYFLYCFMQIVYDFLPLVLIFRQHNNHYSQNTSDSDSHVYLSRPTSTIYHCSSVSHQDKSGNNLAASEQADLK